MRQVEVFRGPQGTLYGANALAGLVNVTTSDPTTRSPKPELTVEGGDYDTRTIGGYVSGPLSDSVEGDSPMQQYDSDGYVRNHFLNRDDTNDYDELTMRGKLHWQANDETSFDFAAGYIDIDNGYDAFSSNNPRNTISDQPGKDTQKSQFGSVIATFMQPKDVPDRGDRLARRFRTSNTATTKTGRSSVSIRTATALPTCTARDWTTSSAELRFISNDD